MNELSLFFCGILVSLIALRNMPIFKISFNDLIEKIKEEKRVIQFRKRSKFK